MNTNTNAEVLYDQYVANTYGKAPVTLVKGAGTRVWDDRGNSYLDFVSGIAVNALGHAHPTWVRRISEQAAQIAHCSNLYRNETQGQLAEKLVALAGGRKKLFFCNSGTEANEALIKLARLYGRSKADGVEGKCYKILCAEHAFHGRTFGGMAATPQEKIQGGFRPMLEGFAFARYNDLASFEAMIDDQTCAIFLETVQGEGGVVPATKEFLQGIRALCDKHGLIFMLDEVQCGAGRSGTYFAYQQFDVQPDAVGMAKGIAGGFPMGAIWMNSDLADLLKPGSHGSTFGGNALAAAAALATLEVMEQEKLLENVQTLSSEFIPKLHALVQKYPQQLTGIRGMGFMLALCIKSDPVAMTQKLLAKGLLTVRAGTDAVRLLPPLNVKREELDEALQIIEQCLQEAAT